MATHIRSFTLILYLFSSLVICCQTGCGRGDSKSTKNDESESSTKTQTEVAKNKNAQPIENDSEANQESSRQPDIAKKPAETSGNSSDEKPPVKSDAEPNQPIQTSDETPSSAPLPADESAKSLEQLNAKVASFQVPPAWLAAVQSKWDVAAKPWKEGRVEIRRLLGLNTEAGRREGIKLTWDYLQKGDIGDGHEYGMYMFLGGEPIWAVIAYRERLAKTDHKYPPYFGIKALASLYSNYGAFAEAERVLKKGVKLRPPQRAWYEMREAEMHDALGDMYAVWGKSDPTKLDLAKASYQEAIRLYPLGKPPYGRHLLPRRAKKVRTKLDLLSVATLATSTLKDGTYRDTALGYSGDIKLTVKIAGGKISKIDLAHQEKIDQNACKIVPQQITEKQTLQIDSISGATVTQDAIIAGTLRTLRTAGLK